VSTVEINNILPVMQQRRPMLKSLLNSLLILIALVVASAILPFASFWLCHDPLGGQVFFWVAPWTCAFWTLLASVLIGSRFWRGKGTVKAWRAARGGSVRSAGKSTAWMFFGLFASYAAQFAVVLLLPASPLARALFPLATYSPAIFAAMWCGRG
jgi:hypothetical protein